MAIAEVTLGEHLLGEMALVPVDVAVMDPSLGLAHGGIDPNAVVTVSLANQGSTFVEHEATPLACKVGEPLFLCADLQGAQLDQSDAGIERLLVCE